MAKTIAITGKGGTGKTAVATMAVRTLLDAGLTPVLAVDADPNCNFDAALGVQPELTLGGVRESEVAERGLQPAGMSKPEYFEYRTRQALVEGVGFDFLAMGRPEGPGCYCFANSLLRDALDRLVNAYEWIVVDCEAGLEHFSRRTARSIDLLVALSDPSRRGLDTVRNVLNLAASLETPVGETVVAVNRCPSPVPQGVLDSAAALGLEVAGYLPEDPEVTRRDVLGEPLLATPGDGALLSAVRELLAGTKTVGAPAAGVSERP